MVAAPFPRSRRRPPVDTLLSVPTPEGCDLSLRLAGPVVRCWAFMIDAILRLLIFTAASIALGFAGAFGVGLAALLFFVLEWLYPTLFEAYFQGATPGKRACGLAVIRDDGTPVSLDAAVIRNLLRVVDALPIGYAVGIVAMGLDGYGRRLGDMLAGTVVVYSVPPAALNSGPSGAEGEPLPFPLAAQEQRAILEFRRRAPNLTAERLNELAMLAEPLTRGYSPEAGRDRLFRIADYLLGRDAARASGLKGDGERAAPGESANRKSADPRVRA